jgi:hypothetical protein
MSLGHFFSIMNLYLEHFFGGAMTLLVHERIDEAANRDPQAPLLAGVTA